jgi:hypothetical protein
VQRQLTMWRMCCMPAMVGALGKKRSFCGDDPGFTPAALQN